MTKQLRTLTLVVFASSITATGAHAAAVELSGTSVPATPVCEVGTCASPGSISAGQTTGVTPFSFLFTSTNGDQYAVSGLYLASYEYNGNGGSFFQTNLAVSYIGGTPTTAADTFTIDVLENIFDSSPGNFNGNYTENIPVTLNGAGSSATGQFLWDGQTVGLLSFPGPGSIDKTATANLTGLTGNTLTGDAQFSFTFAAGTTFGAGANVTSIPEPAEAAPALFSFLLGAAWVGFRRRSSSGTIENQRTL